MSDDPFVTHCSLLFTVAYQKLSSAADAEDVVQVIPAEGFKMNLALWIVAGLLAAVGLVMIMVGATITRIRRHEVKFVLGDLLYLALAGFVAWGRFGPESFTG